MAVSVFDLLVGLGARFDDRVTGKLSEFAKNAKIAHIDIDPSSIGKIIAVDYPIVGDLKHIVSDMMIELSGYDTQKIMRWREHLRSYALTHPMSFEDSVDSIKPQWVIQRLGEHLGDNAIITTDVGQHQMWAAQFYSYRRPRQLFTSGGLGTMGYGLGACIGAKVGRPDKICVNIAGDGGFRMNLNELATASRYNIPIIQIVINNHVLGMVRQWQTLFYEKRYSQTVLQDKVDFCKVAEGLGCEAILVTKKEDVAPAVEKAIALKKPVLLNCVIPEDDKVFPMVPAGAPISEAFDAGDLK